MHLSEVLCTDGEEQTVRVSNQASFVVIIYETVYSYDWKNIPNAVVVACHQSARRERKKRECVCACVVCVCVCVCSVCERECVCV